MIALDLRPALTPTSAPMAWIRAPAELLASSSTSCDETVYRVRFDLSANIEHAPLHDVLTDRARIWYTSRDLHEFIKHHKSIVIEARRRMKGKAPSKSLDREEVQCVRGLESHLSMRAEIDARSRKVTVIQVVLDEQRRQEEDGEERNEGRIRKRCRAASKQSRRMAREVGNEDAIAVVKCWKEAEEVSVPRPPLRQNSRRMLVRQSRRCLTVEVEPSLDQESHMLFIDTTNTPVAEEIALERLE